MPNPEDWFVVGRVLRPRGRSGEVVVEADNPDPGRYLGRILTVARGGARSNSERLAVANAWVHQSRLILQFAGVNAIESAETLRDVELCLQRKDLPPLDPGEYYYSDLVGCRVFSQGLDAGEVVDWQEGVQTLLVVRKPDGREWLLPFVENLRRRVDIEERRIEVDLPEGLDELE